jgi:(p)ppGpp synthase/HD superfamily hydrolase
MNLIIKAARFAKDCHRGQVRRFTGQPYITHPAKVANDVMLIENFGEDEICTAWLHDCVCGKSITIPVIEKEFNENISQLIWELTNLRKGKYPPNSEFEKKKSRREVSWSAANIKALERSDNLCESFKAPKDWIIDYLQDTKENLLQLNMLQEVRQKLLFSMNTLGRKVGLEF